MCGIAGILTTAGDTDAEMRTAAQAMIDRLHHRGPDGEGLWTDAAVGVALGHRRLAILDLSPAGRQPMQSACGRYVLTFNGEIYNFSDLRRELEAQGHHFRGRSDTEVLLACVTAWGVEAAVPRLNGMFAFALWDRQRAQLVLARDRFGEKPLYYGWCGRHFLFASELKALRAHPAFRGRLDREAIALYLRHNYIPAPYSIYQGISKLSPGTMAWMSALDVGQPPVTTRYWSVEQTAVRGLADPYTGSEQDAVAQLDRLLRDAIRLRMQADVPLGAFLSGGVDSSTVVALMQAQSLRPIKTFTIGFQDQQYNEAAEAHRVATHLGTDHTELYVSPADTLAVIPRLPTMYDEPFSDSSQIPTFLVAQLARQSVTVSLSGDGGDELFAGYQRYDVGQAVWRRLAHVPQSLRPLLAGALGTLTSPQGLAAIRGLSPLLPARFRKGHPGHKLDRLIQAITADRFDLVYRLIVSHWSRPEELLPGVSDAPTIWTTPDQTDGQPLQDPLDRMMCLDQQTYLPDDILVKVDRASMAVGLEARVPLLDPSLVSFAWRLPQRLKVQRGQTKWLLKQVLANYVPRQLTDRPKMGFGVPIESWLRGPLREWAAALLDPSRLRHQGLFDPAPIQLRWEEHCSGRGNWHYLLWDVLMFQAWMDVSAHEPAQEAALV